MQPQAPPRRKSSAGIIFAILLVVGLFFCGLILAAVGVLFFARTKARSIEVPARREVVRNQVELLHAEMEAPRNHARAHEQLEHAVNHQHAVAKSRPENRVKEPIRVANREISLQLDERGKIKMDGKSVEQKQLATLLRNAGKGRESALSVTIKADKKCLFEYVANVLSVCQQLDIPNVRISAAQ